MQCLVEFHFAPIKSASDRPNTLQARPDYEEFDTRCQADWQPLGLA